MKCELNLLKQHRDELRHIDEQLLDLLGARLELVRSIGQLKKKLGLPVEDPGRELQNLEASQRYAAGKIDSKMIAEFTELLVHFSKSVQRGS